MLNVIWLVMIVVAVLVGCFTGQAETMTKGAFDTAKAAVMDIALPLVGLMAIWLGMMRLAERAGLVQLLARGLRPIMRRLFPEVPADHPAQGAMVLNMAANMLGLGNAATPLGLRAMTLLQKLNPHPAVASNSMVTFLAVNTASIQLIPTTAISILAVQNARNPSGIVMPALISTAVAMTCGIIAAKVFSGLKAFQIAPDEPRAEVIAADAPVEEGASALEEPPAMPAWGRLLVFTFIGAFVAMLALKVGPEIQKAGPELTAIPWYAAMGKLIVIVGGAMSALAVPFLLSFFPLYAWLRGVKVYEQFCDGAKDAFATAQRIVPFLVAMLVAIRMLRDAGVIQMITNGLAPVLSWIHFPADLLPLALMRPLSGSASQGIFVDLVKTHGADSLIGQTAATIYGSTETTFYVLAVYFGSVGIRKVRHAVIAGLIADIVAIAMAVTVCRWWLG